MVVTSVKKIVAEIFKKAWFPGKESLLYFEDLEKKQVRIWQDSADSGFILNNKTRLEARQEIKKLLDIYTATIERGYGKDTTTTMFIPFEEDEGFFVGVEMVLYFHEGGKNQTEPGKPKYDPSFLSISFSRDKKKDFKYKKEAQRSVSIPF